MIDKSECAKKKDMEEENCLLQFSQWEAANKARYVNFPGEEYEDSCLQVLKSKALFSFLSFSFPFLKNKGTSFDAKLGSTTHLAPDTVRYLKLFGVWENGTKYS